jgi:hypothetical protein
MIVTTPATASSLLEDSSKEQFIQSKVPVW